MQHLGHEMLPLRSERKIKMIRLLVIGTFLAVTSATAAQAADPAQGEKVFKSQCAVCHSITPGRNVIGPSLFGVVGRKSGQVSGFHYSNANKNSNLTWDEATLNKYLADPRGLVPGTLMTYAGLKDDTKRADLIAYLATLH